MRKVLQLLEEIKVFVFSLKSDETHHEVFASFVETLVHVHYVRQPKARIRFFLIG